MKNAQGPASQRWLSFRHATPAPERIISAHRLAYAYRFSGHSYSAFWPPQDWVRCLAG
jgi:hypothetical protein